MVNDPLTGPAFPAPGLLPPGVRVYAIGDVHGCAERLFALHELIAGHGRRAPVPQAQIVHLGDYVDRGPGSAAVVRRLAAGPVAGLPTTCLRGNHEQMLLDAVDDRWGARRAWLANNADVTLQSWGADPAAPPAAWRAALAPELPFLRALKLHHVVGGYVFVHAGLRPGTKLARQTAEDRLWIREGFLDWRGPLLPEAPGMAAVHGHTPAAKPQFAGQRLGIDTGAVMGGPLTCAVLEGTEVRFLTS